MKTVTTLLAVLTITVLNTFAQSPEGLNYQAVVRNGSGQIIANQSVSYQFNILQGSPTGTEVYSESHAVSTDDRGLVNMIIGEGSTSDDFSTIDWGSGTFYLEVEIDENGGSNYTNMGASQLMSVPYALHAKTAENVDDADASTSNELQDLSLNGNTLSISSGNSVTLPSSSVDNDAIAKAWVHVPITGDPNLSFESYGVTNVTRTTTGVYNVSFSPGTFGIATQPAMVATVANDLAPGFAIPTYSASPSQVTVRTYNSSGTLEDKEFNLVVFGLE